MATDRIGGRSVAPKSVTRPQLEALHGQLTAAGGNLATRRGRGQFAYEALAWRGMPWRHGGQLEWLSEYEAGIVLEALAEQLRAGRPR